MSLFICTQDEFNREKYHTSKGIRNKTPPRFSSKSERTLGRSVEGPTIFSHSFPEAPASDQLEAKTKTDAKQQLNFTDKKKTGAKRGKPRGRSGRDGATHTASA